MATDAEIEDALAGRFGPVVFRIESQRLNLAGINIGFITDAVVSVRVSLDNLQPVARQAQFTILPEFLPADWDSTNELVKVVMKLTVDTEYDTDIDIGVFKWEDAARSQAPGADQGDVPEPEPPPGPPAATTTTGPGSQIMSVAASDASPTILGQALRDENFTIAAGQNYITEVETILDSHGLRHALPANAAVTPVIFTWEPGTTDLDICNALLWAINHYALFTVADGELQTRERIDVGVDAVSGVGSQFYGTSEEPRMIVPPWQESAVVQGVLNRLALVVEDPRRAPIAVTAESQDPANIASTVATGIVNGERVVADRILDAPTLSDVVEYELRQEANRAEPVEFRTVLDPRRGPREFYRIFIFENDVALVNNTYWQAMSWSMDLVPGAIMSHKLIPAVDWAITEV